MRRWLILHCRRSLGRGLQSLATRLLTEPALLNELRGDALTEAVGEYGCTRETDKELRARVKALLSRPDYRDPAVPWGIN